MKVCLGGTFHPFHIGHEALLLEAFRDAQHVFVGITEGKLAARDRDVPDVESRAATIRAFAQAAGFTGDLVLRPLKDRNGPAATGDYDAIVVSEETLAGADAINAARAEAGLRPLQVREVPYVAAADGQPISATRIAAGDVDRDGHRLTPVRIAVGSANPVKVAAVEQETTRILSHDGARSIAVEVRGFPVDSLVPEQPQGAQTMRGAGNRARAAAEAWPECDYAVGVEAGLNQDPEDTAWYDVQACVVLDRLGRETDGWGPAFRYPAWVTERALAGEMISKILGPVANDPRIGGTTGAVGFLTDGLMDRTQLTRIAVLMAWLPRLRPEMSRSR